jgi:tol-pal system protein YbgF
MSPRTPALLCLLSLLGLLSGCVLDRTGQSATEEYKKQMRMHGARIDNLEKQVDKMDAKLAELDALTQSRGEQEVLRMDTMEQLRGEVARLRGETDAMKFTTERATADEQKRLEDAAFRLEWLDLRAAQLERTLGVKAPPPPTRDATASKDPAGAAKDPASKDPAPKDPAAKDPGAAPEVKDPAELVKLANDHIKAGRNEAAEAVLNRMLKENPTHEKAAEARYRLGEVAYNSKNYPLAVLRFQEVIDSHKKTKWAPWAMLRQGEAFAAQGQKDNAELFYEELVKKWPDSDAAKEAKEKLKKKK